MRWLGNSSLKQMTKKSSLRFMQMANVNTFTLLDGYQTLGTSRQVMTECNWGGGVVKYLSSDLHTFQRVTPEASGGFKPTCGLATVSRS